jgi:hypothetical protein
VILNPTMRLVSHLRAEHLVSTNRLPHRTASSPFGLGFSSNRIIYTPRAQILV